MRYFEWDRLRLNKGYETGNLVFKHSIKFELFRSYRKKVTWNAIGHNNMALFYGNLTSQRDVFIENIAKQSLKFSESVAIDLYNFSGEMSNLGESFEKQYTPFNYHHYLDTFEKFIDDVVDFRNEIRDGMKKKQQIEATDRKAQFILVNLDDKVLSCLKNEELYQKIEDLIIDSSWERVFFVPITSSATVFQNDLHSNFDWSVYLGSQNDDYLHNIHSTMEDSYYSRQQKVIGSVFDKNFNKILIIHPLKFTPSAFHFEVEDRFKEEDELYNKFLSTLDDGR